MPDTRAKALNPTAEAVRHFMTLGLGGFRLMMAAGLVINASLNFVVAAHIGSALAFGAALVIAGGQGLTLVAAHFARGIRAATPLAAVMRIETAFGIGAIMISAAMAAMVLMVLHARLPWDFATLLLMAAMAVMAVATATSPGRVPLVMAELALVGGAIAAGLLLFRPSPATITAAAGLVGYAAASAHLAILQNRRSIALLAARHRHEQLEAQARAETEQLAAALRLLGHGVMITDRDNRVAMANDRFRDLLGLPEALLPIGAPWHDMLRLSPRLVVKGDAARRAMIHRAVAMARTDAAIETVLRLDDGRILDVEFTRSGGGSHIIVLRDVTDEAAARATLEREARRCPLTGLANRRAFESELAKRLSVATPAAPTLLVLADLRTFKAINDNYGHPVGDAVLIRVGIWLRTALPGTFVSRVGGDEFAVIAAVADDGEAEALAGKVEETLRGLADVDGIPIDVVGRVGYALAPVDAESPVDLFRRADLALLATRDTPGRGIQRFHPGLEVKASEQIRQERAIAKMLAGGDVGVAYQPAFSLASGEATTIEALVRWPQAPGEPLTTSRLVSLAEAGGRVAQLREQVMLQAIRDIARLPQPIELAINISAIEMQDPHFVDDILGHLATAGFPPPRLHLEITESAVHHNLGQTALHMARLRAAGVRLAIDDFGTGYSSLANLGRLPVDRLKLDRSLLSFEAGSAASVVLAGAVAIGRGLGLEIVAEGVEAVPQLTELKRLEIDAAQGFLLAMPVPAAGIGAAIVQGRERLGVLLAAMAAAPSPLSPRGPGMARRAHPVRTKADPSGPAR